MVSPNELHSRDIVIADPKYPDQKKEKERPLVIISKDLFHQNSGFCVCLGITTNKEKDPYLIPISRKNIEGGVLDNDVQIMCKRLVTLRCDKILKKTGARVTSKFFAKIIAKLDKDVLEK